MTDACFCDFDYPEFYHAENRCAAKMHKCGECGGKINPGDGYEYVSAKSDGSFWDAKTCQRCVDLREWVQAHVPCFCWAHGSMRENAKETVEEYAHECPGLFMGFGRRYLAQERKHDL